MRLARSNSYAPAIKIVVLEDQTVRQKQQIAWERCKQDQSEQKLSASLTLKETSLAKTKPIKAYELSAEIVPSSPVPYATHCLVLLKHLSKARCDHKAIDLPINQVVLVLIEQIVHH